MRFDSPLGIIRKAHTREIVQAAFEEAGGQQSATFWQNLPNRDLPKSCDPTKKIHPFQRLGIDSQGSLPVG